MVSRAAWTEYGTQAARHSFANVLIQLGILDQVERDPTPEDGVPRSCWQRRVREDAQVISLHETQAENLHEVCVGRDVHPEITVEGLARVPKAQELARLSKFFILFLGARTRESAAVVLEVPNRRLCEVGWGVEMIQGIGSFLSKEFQVLALSSSSCRSRR